jgi:hypothetical protein
MFRSYRWAIGQNMTVSGTGHSCPILEQIKNQPFTTQRTRRWLSHCALSTRTAFAAGRKTWRRVEGHPGAKESIKFEGFALPHRKSRPVNRAAAISGKQSMQRLFLLTAAGILVFAAANAQTITNGPADGAHLSAGQIAPTRIQVQMNISQRVTRDGVDEQRRVEEAVRRSLYETAMNECTVISAVFKAGCKMASLNVNSNAQERNENLYSINGNATGTYELTPQQ